MENISLTTAEWNMMECLWDHSPRTGREAVELLETYDMYAAANGCYHFHIADNTGDSVVVSYVNNEMVVTEMEGNYQAATNFYLHDVPFEYEKQGEDRYEILVTNLKKKNGILTPEEGMDLLHKASLTDTEPDEEGRVYPLSNQASTVLDILRLECENLGVKTVTDCNIFFDLFLNFINIYDIINNDYCAN